ncbi:PREDICTED: probable 3-hydroxyisobutyrate dehydrogenase-like 1, mitochondrial [Nelumbo nucifera]|uniref:Probable 3-hydroxyisobutyrate dehydrogenase-like 1, mitochondrial n=1 Tax=Nelumbo nucifera TaxID=4432 RepID=A0A1U8AHI8_NELNU|nr:PREDICTED: probable 3-hydroxyisobutyrate dehydrogenase-like 1, mitochondrial [Nelumbo nucifera]XP_010267118.1 PREDICTED: probable 3-hydroxyisobutyrate dehydrogenase-like 1, mitochondrial [Nelumbo nucifera]XP_010267119.1 PREDICTED: probable 3-hydroxyisobutyrate dehydrogenase-like 1, mitochondrial [Nelumbo nucifera]XP_010267121.1 PREDICTED: probable 3-hydroxyisobutyrate dehydrogenase-like 1, mitochondrial [Nelumbo nucifera]XP_010267131.1 PREDICTED: probable 3-hydroxyisobutyrate dehydrogenase-l
MRSLLRLRSLLQGRRPRPSTITPFLDLDYLCCFMATTTGTTAEPMSPSNTRVGWIGTGVMGQSMCAHLIRAGFSLTVYNRTQSKALPLLDMGAQYAPSPLAVASSSDVVFTIVGYPSDVKSVLLGSSGALHGLRPGGVLVDMTTSDPSLAVEISTAAASKGCASVDAPVSGGDRGAKSGTLAIFAGGDESVVRRLSPLFNCLGKVNYMGGPGKGQFAKLANQITIASTMVGLVEGMVYAHKAGLDVELYLNAISTGAAGSKSLDLYGSRILKRDFEAGFFVNHFVKDLGICLRECQNMGLALPGLALSQQLYLSLKAHGEGNLGVQSLILILERLNNISLELATSLPRSTS